jgi:hypothetical protein
VIGVLLSGAGGAEGKGRMRGRREEKKQAVFIVGPFRIGYDCGSFSPLVVQ